MNGFLTDWHRSGGDTGFPKVEEHALPLSHDFFLKTPELNLMPTPMLPSPKLRMNPPSHYWKVNPPSMKWLLEKNKKKSETVINTCFTHKMTLEKDGRNSTKMRFSHLQHSKFCKNSETVRKYYITRSSWHRKISWFYFMPCVITNCLVLLRNFVKRLVE